MPNRASSRAVTRVSSQRMRSTLRNTQSAAQRDVAEIADRRRDEMQAGRQRVLRRPVAGVGLGRRAREIASRRVYLPRWVYLPSVRWLGSAPALTTLSGDLSCAATVPRFASTLLAFALLLALAACGGRMVPAPAGSPQLPLRRRRRGAVARTRSSRRTPLPPGRPGQSGAAGAAVGAQCRTRQGDAGGGATGPVRDRQRPADPGAARQRRHRRGRRQCGALGDLGRARP